MINVEIQVGNSGEKLKEAWIGLQRVPSPSLPQKCYDNWVKRASLHKNLEETVPIFHARQKAWEVVKTVTSTDNIKNPVQNLVIFGGIEMSFEVARHLALTSHAAITWSIYDRLANVCGRLAGTVELANNPKQNPKACEDFLGKKDRLGFDAHSTIKEAYNWPLKVTYKIRNWLIHEGYEANSLPLFKGNRIADGFQLNDDAKRNLEKCCDYSSNDGTITGCCLSAAEECWSSGDVLEIIEKYNGEVDKMFKSLVAWSTDSFISHVSDQDK